MLFAGKPAKGRRCSPVSWSRPPTWGRAATPASSGSTPWRTWWGVGDMAMKDMDMGPPPTTTRISARYLWIWDFSCTFQLGICECKLELAFAVGGHIPPWYFSWSELGWNCNCSRTISRHAWVALFDISISNRLEFGISNRAMHEHRMCLIFWNSGSWRKRWNLPYFQHWYFSWAEGMKM